MSVLEVKVGEVLQGEGVLQAVGVEVASGVD